jgi:hypothetical protein
MGMPPGGRYQLACQDCRWPPLNLSTCTEMPNFSSVRGLLLKSQEVIHVPTLAVGTRAGFGRVAVSARHSCPNSHSLMRRSV